MHTCPMVTGTVPHVGGPVLPPGEPTVLIGMMPAARVGDMATCTGPPDTIAKGSLTVKIGNKPAARIGDNTVHGGVITVGCPTVDIGDLSAAAAGSAGADQNPQAYSAQAQTLVAAKQSGTPFCEVCAAAAAAAIAKSAPPMTKPPEEKKASPDVCDLKSLTIACGHKERGYVLIAGSKDSKTGQVQRLLEVAAGPEGDMLDVSTATQKPYCPQHIKRPLIASPGALTLRSVTPASAAGSLLVRPQQALIEAFHGTGIRLLWPSNYDALSYWVSAETCGRGEKAEIRCFPAIKAELEIAMKFAPKGQADEKGSFSGRALVEFGGKKRELTAEWQRHINTVLGFVMDTKNLVDRFQSALQKVGNIRTGIEWPSVSLSGKWERKEITNSWKTGLDAEYSFGADPLIGASVTVNFLDALLQLIPPLTAIIKAKDAMEAAAQMEVGAFLKLKGKASVTAKWVRTVEKPSWEVSGGLDGKLEGLIYGGIESTGEKTFAEFTVGGRVTVELSFARVFGGDAGIGIEGIGAKCEGAELFAVCVVKLSSKFRFIPDVNYDRAIKTSFLQFEWTPGRYMVHQPAGK